MPHTRTAVVTQASRELSLDTNQAVISATTPAYDYWDVSGCGLDFMPWCSADANTPRLPFSGTADAYQVKTPFEGFSGSRVSSAGINTGHIMSSNYAQNWPRSSNYTQSPLLASSNISANRFPGIGSVSPDAWVGDADSDTCERDLFSPVTDGGFTSVGSSTIPPERYISPSFKIESSSILPLKRSLSETSTTSIDTFTLSSHLSQTRTQTMREMANQVSGDYSSSGCGRNGTITMNATTTSTTTTTKRGSVQLRTASRKPKSKANRKLSSTSSHSSPASERSTQRAEAGPASKKACKPAASIAATKEAAAADDANMMDACGGDDDDSLTPEERRARRNHNLVEKQYRNRLNAQFERLLAILPADQRTGYDAHHIKGSIKESSNVSLGDKGTGDGKEGETIPEEKRMSKAEVLDLATRRIKTLEQETRRLHRERQELMQSVEMMGNAVAARAGRGFGVGMGMGRC